MTENFSEQPKCDRCDSLISGSIQSARDGGTYCRTCTLQIATEIVSKAESDEAKRQAEIARKKSRAGRGSLVFQYLIILTGIIFIILQVPSISRSLQSEKPLRYGTYETDRAADKCISNLWEISGLLQQGQPPGDDLTCPVSAKAYVLTRKNGRLTVSCPNPGLHRLRVLQVSRGAPVPVALK